MGVNRSRLYTFFLICLLASVLYFSTEAEEILVKGPGFTLQDAGMAQWPLSVTVFDSQCTALDLVQESHAVSPSQPMESISLRQREVIALPVGDGFLATLGLAIIGPESFILSVRHWLLPQPRDGWRDKITRVTVFQKVYAFPFVGGLVALVISFICRIIL